MMMDTPVLNARSLLPRRHPSAWMAAGLGLASLVSGPIVGVPALLLVRRIRVDLARNRGHLTGRHLVLVGGVVAWTSTITWAIAAATGVVVLSPAATYVVPSIAAVLAVALYLWKQPRWLVGVSLVGGLIATIGGDQVRHIILRGRAIEQMHECDVASQSADSAWHSQQYQDAHSRYRRVAATCMGDTVQIATARMQYIAAVTERSGQAESARLQQVEATETARQSDQRNSAAVRRRARFAAIEGAAGGKLAEAKRLASGKKWEKAAELLQGLNDELETFQNTEVGSTQRWKDLVTARRSIAERVQPGLDKAIARRQAEETRKAEVEARRQQRLSDRVECCDGTISPSCRHSQGSLRGCCSHHGGVC